MSEQETSTALAISNAISNSVYMPRHWEMFQHLPCKLSLQIDTPRFTVETLLRLAPGDVVNTHWLQGSDVPLYANGKLIGWTEFEVIDDHLAARLTQLA